eukprot:CAMPEP_0179420384 /NCGR_PEP_ID=MMETSP0799-20121207/9141_1 /TAXON_ID=46947 /ORGANISM="Geminigera cryophila, Strain CCMP2564" /LENGTH=302 /DNA_ID=CAMNT_0021193995 /DNA_START=159 /DNA_END=1067 /DNA_ORIENTATION=+
MGERKVLNKYYPPDFDPELLPRNKKPKDRQIVVRIMIPFTLCCETCKEFSYRGKKFNSKKEIAQDITYLGLWIHRFFIKCPRCSSEIVFRTDPETSDYMMESGATRNYEVWNDRRGEVEVDEEADAMQALEARTQDSKIEMDILDALDDTKSINKRKLTVDTSKILGKMRAKEAAAEMDKIELGDEEEDEIENIEFASSSRRIGEDEEERRNKEREEVMAASRAAAAAAASGGSAAPAPKRLAGLLVKRKEPEAPSAATAAVGENGAASGEGGLGVAKVQEPPAPAISLGSMLPSDSGSSSD